MTQHDPTVTPGDVPQDSNPDRGGRRRVAVAVVFSAALAMTATLPGRTHGLGLATTRLLAEFPQLDPTSFAQINLFATLVGSAFCLPCGWLVDRFGVRPVLGAAMAALAVTVVLMSGVRDPAR